MGVAHQSPASSELPDLMDRIEQMGLTEEYMAYRERYLGWRMGKSESIHRELTDLTPSRSIVEGWGHWYPTLEEWQWRRTLAYWIAVTFFEGSLFFTFSSFIACYSSRLGHLKAALTTWGYAAGKVNYFVCTYFMCLETINMTNAEFHRDSSMLDINSDSDAESTTQDSLDQRRHFKLWPFHWRTALRNLARLGIGPWPYLASAAYFVGVWVFAVGLAAELIRSVPEEVASQVVFYSFVLGSFLFTAGGVFECIENGVFKTIKCDSGYIGAVLNTLGGILFLVGSLLGYSEAYAFQADFLFGLGSAIFSLGSGVMIIMWKDEQFGLTFLAVLNDLGGLNGRPFVRRDSQRVEENTFSIRGASFIMIYCLTATVSIFDFLVVLWDRDPRMPYYYIVERAFNALLPCVFAHMMLALNAGVYKTPRLAPFHQLYIACRFIAVLMAMNSTARVYQAVVMAMREEVVALPEEVIVMPMK